MRDITLGIIFLVVVVGLFGGFVLPILLPIMAVVGAGALLAALLIQAADKMANLLAKVRKTGPYARDMNPNDQEAANQERRQEG